MPFERREILFYLNEIGPALLAAGHPLVGKIPASGDAQILDALHTREFHHSYRETQAKFRPLFDARGTIDGVMVRASAKGGLLGRDQVIGFIIDDATLTGVLLSACQSHGITLPRMATKKVVAPDMTIGFEMDFDSTGSGFELETD